MSAQQQKINNRFQSIFGGQFRGHHQYVQRRATRLKQQLQLADQKRPNGALLEDFHEIDAYRCIMNLRVCDAIRRGVFQQVDTLDQLPNLVEHEERELFDLEGVEVTAGVKFHPRSAKVAKWRALGAYGGAADGPQSRSLKLVDPLELDTGRQLRQLEDENQKQIRRQNRERMARLARKSQEAAALADSEEKARRAVHGQRQEKLEKEKAARRTIVQDRIAKKNLERLEQCSRWEVERHETAHLLKKEPLYKKLANDYSAHLQEVAVQHKEKTLEERKTKFKPIIQEELAQFSTKVDQIVTYLTRKRQEERTGLRKLPGSVDLVGLRTQTYE